MPPPATITPPTRDVVPAFDVTLNVTVPLVVPEYPPVTAIQAAFDPAVHATFAATVIVLPFQGELVKFVLAGLIVNRFGGGSKGKGGPG